MPFGIPFDRYYENIFAPAVVEAGLNPIRADSLFRPASIMADIWKLVREAKLLLADLTGKNANVFYELGLAHAIGKPVVLVSSNVDDIPFDLRGLRVILYDKDDEAWGATLHEKVVAALKETLDDIAGAVPLPFLEKHDQARPREEPVAQEFRRVWEAIRTIEGRRSVPTVSSMPQSLPQPILDRKALEVAVGSLGPRAALITQEALGTIIAYALGGQVINGIKFFRDVTGMGLKESKDAVEAVRDALIAAGIRLHRI